MNKMGKTILQKQLALWDVKEEYKEIVEILQNQILSTEEIMQNTKDKNLRQTMNLLMNMELEGIIEQEIGVGYKLKWTKQN